VGVTDPLTPEESELIEYGRDSKLLRTPLVNALYTALDAALARAEAAEKEADRWSARALSAEYKLTATEQDAERLAALLRERRSFDPGIEAEGNAEEEALRLHDELVKGGDARGSRGVSQADATEGESLSEIAGPEMDEPWDSAARPDDDIPLGPAGPLNEMGC
jgi:hypothetical protein